MEYSEIGFQSERRIGRGSLPVTRNSLCKACVVGEFDMGSHKKQHNKKMS